MSFIGSMLSGSKGSGFQAQGAPIQTPTSNAQAQTAYGQTQQGLAQQQAFLNALQGQGGIGNQSNVFNQQQQLANQMQGVANGTGPNPAQAALNQATGQNIANQASMMAGQRGAGSNVGMMARQAAQQGANTQQQAVGQGATLQAQQQLAAMQALGQQQSNMGNLATTQVGQQQAGINQYNQAAQSEQQNLLNSIAEQNKAQVGMQSNMNNTNQSMAGINAQGQQNLMGGILGGIGPAASILGIGGAGAGSAASAVPGMGAGASGLTLPALGSSAGYAQGGQIKMASGGMTPEGPQSNVGRFLFSSAPSDTESLPPIQAAQAAPKDSGASSMNSGANSLMQALPAIAMMAAAKGGKVPAMVSPGERYLPPKDAKEVASGKKDPLKAGERIPGKPKVKGDSYANDTVPKTLEEGGFVIPNSIMQTGDSKKAQAFVAAHMKKMALGGKVKK